MVGNKRKVDWSERSHTLRAAVRTRGVAAGCSMSGRWSAQICKWTAHAVTSINVRCIIHGATDKQKASLFRQPTRGTVAPLLRDRYNTRSSLHANCCLRAVMVLHINIKNKNSCCAHVCILILHLTKTAGDNKYSCLSYWPPLFENHHKALKLFGSGFTIERSLTYFPGIISFFRHINQ